MIMKKVAVQGIYKAVWWIILGVQGLGLIQAQGYRPGSPFITHYSKSTYQAGTQNWAFVQDERDLIYIGNNHGLLEFDGVNWRRYALPNHTIARSLALDGEGRLFVGGQGEWGYFRANEKGENVFHSLLPFFPKEQRSFDDVWKTFVTEGGIIGVAQNMIMRWDGKQISLLKAEEDSRFDNAYQLGKKLYVHDWQKGLMELNESFLLQPVPDGERLKQITLASILPMEGDKIRVITAQKGIFYYDGKHFVESSGQAHDFLKKYQAYCGIRLQDGNFAFGSPQNGLLLSNPQGDVIWHINKEQGLTNNTVLSMLQDRQGHLWLGLDNGLNYVEINSPFSILGPTEGIEGTGYTSAFHDGKMYLGTNQGVYAHSWPAHQALSFQLIPGFSGQVWALSEWGDSLWVGRHEGAFFSYKNQNQQLSQVAGAWKFLPLRHHPGYAVGGTYDGLVRYRRQGGHWIAESRIPGFSESSRVMEEGDSGDLWVTHFYRGVFKLTLSDDLTQLETVTSYDSSSGLPSSFSVNVCRIYNELIFTTLKGVFKYLPAEDRFIPHPVFDSVFAQTPPRWLWEAPDGNVWFSAGLEFGFLQIENKGLEYSLKKVRLNRLQPALVEGFEQVFPLDENNVFIATEGGFVHYNPSFNSGVVHPQKIHIRTVLDQQADSLIYGGAQSFGSALDSVCLLSSHIHSLRFSFAATQFSEKAHTQYRFQLKGLNESWSAWDEKTEKEYSNLASGRYEFQVQARNDLGAASTVSSFFFEIESPWYLKPAARIFWVMLFLMGLACVFLLNRRRMSRKADALVQASKAELERKEAAFQQTLEENEAEILQLRNDKLRNEIEFKKQELASTTMHLLQKSEILFKLKNELTRLSKQVPENQRKEVKQIIKAIEQDVKLDENWNSFEHHFDRVHEDFIKRLRETYPQLTPKDLKLAAYLRMNLVTKEVAPLLNISVRGVEISRYRLRKKMELDRDTNLVEYMMNF